MTNTLLNQVNKSAESGRIKDQNEDSGFVRELIPEGKYPARFIGYVEVGDRDGGEYQGKKKPNTRKAYLFFQLLSPKLAREVEVDGEKRTIYPVHREMIDVKTGEKANLTKLFKRMANGRALTTIAQMLGEAFRVGISHHSKGEGAEKKTYENIRTKDDGWLVYPPVYEVVDPETGESTTKRLKVIEANEPLKLLLWDDPSPEQWDSIKGRPFEYKVKGSEEKVTCEGGFYHYVCMNEALDFAGSPLEAMLSGGDLPDMTPDVLDEEPQDEKPADDVPQEDPLADIPDMPDLDDEIPH